MPMSSSGRPVTGFARPGTGTARPGTTSGNKPGTALSAALKGARPGTGSTRPLTTSGRYTKLESDCAAPALTEVVVQHAL